jgi:hypothetical protein
MPEGLSTDEEHDMQVSQAELYAFFRALYASVYDHPERFGLPTAEDVYTVEGDGKEAKRDVARATKKPRDKMAYGIEFLYLAGQRGALFEGHLGLGNDDYAAFLTKGPRVKKRFLKGMEEVGLTVSEAEDATLVGNTQYPNMMLALKALAEACLQRGDDNLSRYLFARCDLRALDVDYQPDALDVLRTAISPSEYEQAIELHHALAQMGYTPALEIGNVSDWRIQYQGQRAIKATPFFEFEYDDRRKHQLAIQVKCASTNRLVPLLAQQPAVLQQDFYRHAHLCGAPKCSWCKSREALGPSVVEWDGEKKIICWWMQRRFAEVDGEAVDLVVRYAMLHQALVPA